MGVLISIARYIDGAADQYTTKDIWISVGQNVLEVHFSVLIIASDAK